MTLTFCQQIIFGFLSQDKSRPEPRQPIISLSWCIEIEDNHTRLQVPEQYRLVMLAIFF